MLVVFLISKSNHKHSHYNFFLNTFNITQCFSLLVDKRNGVSVEKAAILFFNFDVYILTFLIEE